MSTEKLYSESSVLTAGDASYAIVAARFNSFIVDRLLNAAVQTFKKCGATDAQLTLIRVPGAFEIPLACQRLAETGRFSALLALGCVIRGDTPHFDYVCNESARGISHVALQYNIPVIYGILTTENAEQALARASDMADSNKGADAALTAMEMVNLLNSLQSV